MPVTGSITLQKAGRPMLDIKTQGAYPNPMAFFLPSLPLTRFAFV
ncbi:hypothetical protein APS_1139 [Acetobacter pasteurianus subsp. pasteurianus LMG 1262 = NBRC 106471]|nr:hypothetical protein APS_1139 [Acetobacter pasteurianus subsp. pasteurianus LMG 1262 = NBRC 106471]CCT59102.1 hypothetical protein APA386B_1002 [Acetobacter pasteurianus 386B]